MPNQNAPARKGEGVVCLLGGNTDVFTIIQARVQYLARTGIPSTRAALIAPFCFGEAAR